MWFLNQETGCTWEVTDQELMLRLQTSGHYEQMEEPQPDENAEDEPVTKAQTAKNLKRTEKAQAKEEQEPVHE
ncbi:hypothetical protein [Paenibacillus kribbensis]|uniref:hypothetical protein n=1 Tax=Paenibacillus kribbensis TaxID=172713 RepID=UPI000837C964|nr:hypothetical protein [Paenibacillus kribbensis]